MGLLKFKAGTYKYMSSRNNNFSNRAQKAKIDVLTDPSAPLLAPVNVQAQAVDNTADPAKQTVKLTWQPAGGEPYVATDGKTYTGVTEQYWQVAAYKVQASNDAGANWFNLDECDGVVTECEVSNLMAGTTYSFRVRAGGEGTGWSTPSTASEEAVVQTYDSALSESCQSQIAAQADGQYLTTGAIVGIVLGVFAGLVLIAVIIFMLRRRAPPPPPPAPDYK